MINVSWNDTQEYLRWLNRLTDKGFRLPTEAEWDYAARAGTTTPFSAGACVKSDQANDDDTHALRRSAPGATMAGVTSKAG